MPLRARNGSWHFRFKVGGKPYNGTTGFEATERNRRAAERFEESERQKAIAAAAEQRLEVLDFATAAGKFIAWCEDVNYRSKPSTAQRIKVSFTALVTFFGNLHVAQIDDAAIEAFKESRIIDCGVKDITLRHDLHALSLFFQYSEKKRWSKGNPVRQVAMPSDREAVRMTVITHEQEKAYFAEAGKHVDKAGRPNLYDVGRLMINQGLRPEEIMHAKKANFDEKARTLTIAAGKTRAAQRVIDLMDESFEILKTRMSSGGPWLFPSERYVGRPITKLQGTHDKACRDSGVSFVPYDLRHTFGTRMATEHKTDPFTLASIMGHSNLRTIMRYVHPQQQERKRAIERYEAAQRRRNLKVVAS